MIAFINDHREAYGIEPICKVLPIALSTYHAHIAQRIDPSKRSARAQRDETLKIEVRRVFEENFRVYGARKVWRQLRREGFTIARCTVERLMASLGLQGQNEIAFPCPLHGRRLLLGVGLRFNLVIVTPHEALRRLLESAQYVSIKYTERLAEAGVEPSVGSVGDFLRQRSRRDDQWPL